MIVKIVTLFLIGMAVLAIFGRLRFPGRSGKRAKAACRVCGAPRVGRGRCPCGRA